MIEDKYGIEYVKNKRCYRLNMSEKSFNLDGTSPVIFEIEGKKIEISSWGRLVERIANYMINKREKSVEELLNLRLNWTKQPIFVDNKISNAHLGPLNNGLYINTNHTSTHLCWIVQDLIKSFEKDIDACSIWIKKPPHLEKAEVVKYFFEKNKLKYIWFLEKRLGFDKDKINAIILGLEKIDKLFKKHFPNKISLLLFDEKHDYANFKSKFKRKLNLEIEKESHLNIIYYILDTISKYFQYIHENLIIDSYI